MYINDLENLLKSSISRFSDDTKVGSKALIVSDCEIIQNDLNRIVQWSENWQTPFNVERCKVMHTGPGNCSNSYNMQVMPPKIINEESDLGATISSV